MCSENWKERLVAEYQQLIERIYRMKVMVVLWKENRLDYTPKYLLYVAEDQLQGMERYRESLEYRAICEGIDLR